MDKQPKNNQTSDKRNNPPSFILGMLTKINWCDVLEQINTVFSPLVLQTNHIHLRVASLTGAWLEHLNLQKSKHT